MTEPLTPPECDCRGLPFMPMDVQRILDSDLFALSTGDEFKAAFALWGKSWGQMPAASVPNDERILARLAGLSLKEWRTVSEMALRGWILCTDGRLYHPVVAEKALEAWAARVRQRDRAAKRWQREPVEPPHCAPAMPRHSGGSPAVMQGTGIDKKDTPNPLSGAIAHSEVFAEVCRAYPADGLGSPEKREAAWTDLMAEGVDPASVRQAATAFAASPAAKPERGRVLALHRWLREGRWRNHAKAGTAPRRRGPWPGPPELRADLIELANLSAIQGEGWVRSWLDPGGWQERGSVKAIIAHSPEARKRIEEIAGDFLRGRGIQILVVQESAA